MLSVQRETQTSSVCETRSDGPHVAQWHSYAEVDLGRAEKLIQTARISNWKKTQNLGPKGTAVH
jgi:hypothetical protein